MELSSSADNYHTTLSRELAHVSGFLLKFLLNCVLNFCRLDFVTVFRYYLYMYYVIWFF